MSVASFSLLLLLLLLCAKKPPLNRPQGDSKRFFWTIYPPFTVSGCKKYFHIRSHLGDLVLDVKGGSGAHNTPVISYPKGRPSQTNQLWYYDGPTGTIRTKINDFCMEITGTINGSFFGEVHKVITLIRITCKN